MKFLISCLISFLLEFPVFFVLMAGLPTLTGLPYWWCLPICVLIMLSYDIGEMIRRNIQ